MNELAQSIDARRAVSPSNPLDAAEPSASIVYADEEYDAFVERLEAPATPNERLKKTMLDQPTPER